MIGGDSQLFRAAADQVRGWADGLESDAARLRTADGVHWVGSAGSAFRTRLAERADRALTSGAACDDYASSLDELASALEARQAVLASLLARADATMEEVRQAVAGGAGTVLDVAQGMADSAARAAAAVAEEAADVAGAVHDGAEDAWHRVTPW